MDPGGGMPLHTNQVEHEQYVLAGRARVVIGEEVLEVQKDDVVFIPGGVPHSYQALGDEPFEFLCVVPNLPDQTRIVGEEPSKAADRAASSSGDMSAGLGGQSHSSDDSSEDPALTVPEDELGC
jgi:hypothetical protein